MTVCDVAKSYVGGCYMTVREVSNDVRQRRRMTACDPAPIACTMPGRHGDILWALPTVRALAEQAGAPIDLVISEKYGSLKDLIRRQPYIADVVVLADWQVQETAPMTPR